MARLASSRPAGRRGAPRWLARLPLALAAIGGLAAACSDDPLGPAQDAFRAARAKWQAGGPSAYEFDYRLQCFCGPVTTRPVTVHVEAGEVTAVLFRDGPGEATAEEREFFPTVDELLDRIERTLEQEPVVFEAEYDPELGYPTFVSADVSLQILDEEFAFEVTRLEPLAIP